MSKYSENTDFLMVFIKEPVPGKVKTRLANEFHQDQICSLYKAFVEDFLAQCRKLPDLKMILAYHGRQHVIQQWLPKGPWTYFPQGRGHLGTKLTRAFRWAFSRGAKRCIIVGSDSPTLPVSYIRRAQKMLRHKHVVIGPAWDGGFYLVGIHKPLPPKIFHLITWSSAWTLDQFMERIQRFKISFGLVDPWYDIDDKKDLVFLRNHLLGLTQQQAQAYSRIWTQVNLLLGR